MIWLDIYPLQLPCRYNNKTACYTKVYFTSNKPLTSQYIWLQSDEPETWKAFTRRIHKVKKFMDDGTIKEIPIDPSDQFVEVSESELKYIQETLGF